MWAAQLIEKISEKITSVGDEIAIYRDFSFYTIEEINFKSQMATVRCRGTRRAIKQSFESIVGDTEILGGLSSIHACWIGALYGRVLRASFEKKSALRKANNMSFLLKNKKGKYSFIFENRTGEIGYLDQKSKKEFIEHPLTIARDNRIISRFDPSQACYIGMLAGISLEKALSMDERTGENNTEKLLKKMSALRILD